MNENLTKISIILNEKLAKHLMNALFDAEEYIHWYEDDPTEEDLDNYEELKDAVNIRFSVEKEK